MRSLLIAFLFTIMAVSCEQEQKKPQGLIERDQLIEILTEAQVFESAKQYIADRNPNYSLPKSYAYLFDKYSISEEELKRSLEYYAQDPAEFEAICDEVIVRLTEIQAESVNASRKEGS